MADADQGPAGEGLPRQHGPWRILHSREVYRDPWVRLRQDDVRRPDGHPGSYVVVHLKPGVCVLAMDADRHVYLTREFHYGVGRVTLEAVSGGVEPGEAAEPTARRELGEELGITAGRLTALGTTDPFTANVVSPTALFLAEDLTFGQPDPEGTEQIECVKMPLDEAVRRVMEGEITHAPSCLVILKTAFTQSRK
ncbi:NUDIX domain-containing protein [Roseimaritima sediminicola]|uniref:NUDIX domain-containing protein n=1 Tax=Roseimaritima sediminicola TaxID=2662066 RepID=UPI001298579E|nr:NUDIX hydrolase [Roseimaritima sediminicola]